MYPNSLKLLFLLFLGALLPGCGFIEANTIGLFRDSSQTPEQQDSAQTEAGAQNGAGNAALALETGAVEHLPPPKTSSVDVEKLDLEQAKSGTVEIVWEIPKDSVDAFLIKYGYSKDNLEFTLRVEAAQIEKFEDPKHGVVYRHLMEEVPADKTIFVAMASVKGNTVSELSQVFEVHPGIR